MCYILTQNSLLYNYKIEFLTEWSIYAIQWSHMAESMTHLEYIQTKHFFMEIINTFKQSIAKIFDGTTVFVSCKT
jgi:hypothetical protein